MGLGLYSTSGLTTDVGFKNQEGWSYLQVLVDSSLLKICWLTNGEMSQENIMLFLLYFKKTLKAICSPFRQYQTVSVKTSQ